MRIGDLLISAKNPQCTGEIVGIDGRDVIVFIESKTYLVPKSFIGTRLHLLQYCRQCGDAVSSLFCKKCNYCGSYICRKCNSCQKDTCIFKNNGITRSGTNRNDIDNNGLDAHWKQLIGRNIIYVKPPVTENSQKSKGVIVRCYVDECTHYVDIQLVSGECYKRIKFSDARKNGSLILLKKKENSKKKEIASNKHQKDLHGDAEAIQEIFEEMGAYADAEGEYCTGFGGCYGEDDRESDYYNPGDGVLYYDLYL